MAEAVRGVVSGTTQFDIPASGQLPIACPVCAEHVAVAEVVAADTGVEFTIPADQHGLLNLHRAKYHPTEGEF